MSSTSWLPVCRPVPTSSLKQEVETCCPVVWHELDCPRLRAESCEAEWYLVSPQLTL